MLMGMILRVMVCVGVGLIGFEGGEEILFLHFVILHDYNSKKQINFIEKDFPQTSHTNGILTA